MDQPIINRSYLDKVALKTSGGSYTYQQLLVKIEQFSTLFKGENYSKVAIYAENSADWIAACYAAFQNNCIAVPIDFLAAPGEVAYIVDDCTPDVVFISQAMVETYEKIKTQTKHQPNVFVFEELNFTTTPEKPGNWHGPQDKDTTAVIIYTSGTTGSPKGVMLSYTNIFENVKDVINANIYKPHREVMIFLPLHHVFPLVGSMITPLHVGSTVVIAASMQSTDLMKTFSENHIGVFLGVPRLYELMYRGIKAKIDQSLVARLLLKSVLLTGNRKLGKKVFKKVHDNFGGHLDYMIAGGAALNTEVGNFFHALGFNILEGFGMTEAAPMITFPRPGKVKIGSTGQHLTGLQVEIRDGEIVAKGPSIMKGYYNRPEETAEVIVDGWLHTGDLGRIDEDGFLFITGRKKEIIVLPNGKNINPVELEMKLDGYSPAIKEAGVFMHKEQLHALIYPDLNFIAENGITDIDDYFRTNIIAPFNADLSSYKRIMQFTLIKSELPRTRLSKLQRFKLADLLEEKVETKKAENKPTTAEFKALKTFIESQVDIDVLPEHHLVFDLSLDSLGKLGLIDFIEKSFGIEVSEEQLVKFSSLQELADHIQHEKMFHKTEDNTTWSGDMKDSVDVELPKSSIFLKPIVRAIRAFFSMFFKFEVKGLENIPDGPCFITPNHETKLDAFLVLSYLDKKVLKNTYSYAKKEHVSGKIRSYLAKHNNVIVMDLTNDLKHSIHKMAEVVKQGKKVVIFPEGTRSQSGKLGSFKMTYALLSAELNIPILPVSISGAFEAMSSGKKKINRGSKIKVEFLPVINPENRDANELNKLVKSEIQSARE
ncbi:MAG: AMP-binding protein [Prolixibacteraceae bacterium]|jgi:long-chain acyl-CoA synthetase|nr:AMP-binding protein [Prolixibacteraceae bacterium]